MGDPLRCISNKARANTRFVEDQEWKIVSRVGSAGCPGCYCRAYYATPGSGRHAPLLFLNYGLRTCREFFSFLFTSDRYQQVICRNESSEGRRQVNAQEPDQLARNLELPCEVSRLPLRPSMQAPYVVGSHDHRHSDFVYLLEIHI